MDSDQEETQGLDAILDTIKRLVAEALQQQRIKVDGLAKPVLELEVHVRDSVQNPPSRVKPGRMVLGSVDLSSLKPADATQAFDPSSTENEREGSDQQMVLRSNRPRRSQDCALETDSEKSPKRRKAVGGLRPVRCEQSVSAYDTQDCGVSPTRQLQSNVRSFPQRKARVTKARCSQPSTLDRLIMGIWEQIHGSISFDPQVMLEQWRDTRALEGTDVGAEVGNGNIAAVSRLSDHAFSRMNMICRKITQASRCCRSLEVVVQAHWVQCYDERARALAEENPEASMATARKAALIEACNDFGWSEKDLRNKIAVWRGYREIKEVAGWVALVFAGMGLYRFCKYRIGFDKESMLRLARLRSRFEVAADTIHPQWRQILAQIGEPTNRQYDGHPHDWVVNDSAGPIPLARTYLPWDPQFSFEHLDQSVIDKDVWGPFDPRSSSSIRVDANHICDKCGQRQSDDPQLNACYCFPTLYGSKRGLCPVQVFRTANGKNNGLIACCTFERGAGIGEFVGLVTKGLRDLDVMQGDTETGSYQIWQGRQGNYTRFVNHSCNPNSQFERFSWLGIQRIVLVSKGVEAGGEITVDYSDRYWTNLDKICLCGESCCRYRRRMIDETSENS